MKKYILLLLLSFLLTACGTSGTLESEPETAVDDAPAAEAVPEPMETEADTAEEATIVEETAVEELPTEEDSSGEVSSDSEYPMAATVSEAAVIRDTDWVKGAEDPLITIIEYGDFQ